MRKLGLRQINLLNIDRMAWRVSAKLCFSLQFALLPGTLRGEEAATPSQCYLAFPAAALCLLSSQNTSVFPEVACCQGLVIGTMNNMSIQFLSLKNKTLID